MNKTLTEIVAVIAAIISGIILYLIVRGLAA